MEQPIVTVITPVYNTEKYLPQCIQSILSQTYKNLEYVIVDNRSTDGSGKIAAQYAQRDARVRLVENTRFLNQMQNWNHSMRQISDESRYCKVVHADDWIFPECLEQMVSVAESFPSAGLVGSYRLDETKVNLDGLPWPSSLTSGRDICRWNLLEGGYVFGSPTSTMIRSEIVRARDPFYDETNIHADKAVCFEILKDWDFAFIHQVLTFTRRHNESTTSFIRHFNTVISGKVETLLRYGPTFLEKEEYEERLSKMVKGYHYFLVRSWLEGKDREFFAYQISTMKKMGIPIRFPSLIKAVISESLNLTGCWRRIRNRKKKDDTRESIYDRSFEASIVSRKKADR